MDGSSHRLKELSTEEKKMCATSVTEGIASVADVASFLSASASDCVDGVIEHSYCVADRSALIGSLAVIANFGASVSLACGAPDEEEEEAHHRRLAAPSAGAGAEVAAEWRSRSPGRQ